MEARNLTLLTDLYELTMMQGYFKNEEVNQPAVFDMFYRENPSHGGYAVMAGVEQVAEYIRNLHFESEQIDYLRSLGIFGEDFLDYLKSFRFTGSIWAVPEGSVVFPHEPILKVIAPIMQAQLIETAVLNIINHQCLIATKAARVCYAAGAEVMEFGARRAQGADASIYGARAAVIGGCTGTSNVIAGQMFDIPVKGTNAHSWIMSFPDELTAFRRYAELYPDACVFVADTYDTLKSGVPHAIRVFSEMRDKGIHPKMYGIRLDSGDLAYLSKQTKKMFDEAGFPDAVIIGSNDLDEYLIESLRAQGAKITNWAVGTSLITSKDWSAFGGVYKMAAIMTPDGVLEPKIKISENSEKNTNPGSKKILRIYEKDSGKILADLLCLADETFRESDDLILFDPLEPWKKTKLKGGIYNLREMLEPVFIDGKCCFKPVPVMEIRCICQRELSTLWDETKRFINPHQVYVDLSDTLFKLKKELLAKKGEENIRQ